MRVVEFGACDINGSVRSVYPQAESWLGIDRNPGRGVDVVADVTTWRTKTKFDVCVCAEVFEHSPEWETIIETARKVLKPGGLFLASCATGARPPHSVSGGPLEDGEHYQNISKADMVKALWGWPEHDVKVADGFYGRDDLYVRAVR